MYITETIKKPLTMRILSTLVGLLIFVSISAQDFYFTIYNFSVANEDVSTVYNLMDGYFSKNKLEGVTVTLYENHFSDSDNNFSHSVVFTGTSDALGAMYSRSQNSDWNLFLTQVNMHTDGFSSAMGRSISGFGDNSTPHPVQKYFIFEAEDAAAYDAAYDAYNSKHNPDGRTTAMGTILSGHSDDGANRWVVNRFKDFKSAMEGPNSLRTEAENEASSKAWQERRNNQGGVRLVRSGLRIQLGQW